MSTRRPFAACLIVQTSKPSMCREKVLEPLNTVNVRSKVAMTFPVESHIELFCFLFDVWMMTRPKRQVVGKRTVQTILVDIDNKPGYYDSNSIISLSLASSQDTLEVLRTKYPQQTRNSGCAMIWPSSNLNLMTDGQQPVTYRTMFLVLSIVSRY